jgi:hypothetical protein
MWSAARPPYGTPATVRWQKTYMPRAQARATYGKTLKLASQAQRDQRYADDYMGGTGRYARKLRSYGRRMWKRRMGGKGLYGGGGFFSDMWDRARGGLGQAFKDTAPKWMGNALTAAEGFGKAQGWGAYDTATTNEIVNQGAAMAPDVPSFNAGVGEMGTIQISHKEYVADVFGPDSAGIFQNLTYGLNPALPSTFPWLSQIAANYEEYTIKQLIFTFRTTVSDFVASNGQVGTVIIATQYNSNDAPFANKQEMMEYAGAVSAKVSTGIIAGVECDPAQLSGPAGKYTRSGPTPPGEDIKTYDLGTLNIATSNTPEQFNNQAIGELWVSYTVELRKPKFFVTRAQQLLTDVYIGDNGTSTSTLLGNTPWAECQQNRIGGTLVTTWPTTNTVPPISYPAATDTLYYVLPATFAGDIMVEVYSTSPDCNVVDSPGLYVAQQTAPPGIVPIYDMWRNTTGVGTWTYEQQTAYTGTGPTTAQKSANVYHFTIVSPTTANVTVDNILTLRHPTFAVGSFMLRVSMYNTGLNYARSHRPIMMNPDTEIVVDYPAGQGQMP